MTSLFKVEMLPRSTAVAKNGLRSKANVREIGASGSSLGLVSSFRKPPLLVFILLFSTVSVHAIGILCVGRNIPVGRVTL
jgi:hypothetical protein